MLEKDKLYQEQGRVSFCRNVASGTFLIRFTAPNISRSVKPGQMIFIRTTKRETPLLRRPFAIFDADTEKGAVDVLFGVVGKGTTVLSRKREGDEIDVIGPSGNGFLLPKTGNKRVIAIAGGIGLGPIHFLCKELSNRSIPYLFFCGASSADKLVLKSLVSSVETIITTDDGSYGVKGLVTDAIEKRAKGIPRGSIVYACGPEPMLTAAAKLGRKYGWVVYLSLERHMACGVGACNGCVVDTITEKKEIVRKRVCCDGPVFNAKELPWIYA